MSYLCMGVTNQLMRLGVSSSVTASKILSSTAPACNSLVTSQPQIFAVQRYHTLRQHRQLQDGRQNKGLEVVSSVLSRSPSSSLVLSRPMSSGDHVTLWTAERILSAALVPLLPAALLMPSAPLDYMLAFALTVHSHWGIEAIVVDYVRPSMFGPFIPKLSMGLVYGLSALTLGGLFYFIYTDVGIGQAIRMLWKL